MLERPAISPNFTIEDIHKIREWTYERQKNMTDEERRADNEQYAAPVRERIAQARKKYLQEQQKEVKRNAG